MESLPESYVSDDMLFEILSWMPAKSVIKSSYFVSKTLIYEPQFIRNQSINSSYFDGGFFLQTDTCTNLDFFVLPTESPTVFGIPKDALTFLKNKARVLASSHGLILIRDSHRDEHFSICNPVTKAFAPIPPPENVANLFKFGCSGFVVTCDPRNRSDFPNDFTVVAPLFVEVDDDVWNAEFCLAVYRNGEWDSDTCNLKAPTTCRELRLKTPVAAFSGPNKGLMVHYLCDSLPHADRNPVYLEPYVAAYDMENKRLSTTMKLPEGAWAEDGDHLKLSILKWGKEEAIGIVRIDVRRIVVWKLQSYKPVEWRKVVDSTVTEMGVAEEDGQVVGCSVVNCNGLLFATWKRVYLYEMEGVNAGRLEVVGSHGNTEVEFGLRNLEFTLYSNTLRPVCGQQIHLLNT